MLIFEGWEGRWVAWWMMKMMMFTRRHLKLCRMTRYFNAGNCTNATLRLHSKNHNNSRNTEVKWPMTKLFQVLCVPVLWPCVHSVLQVLGKPTLHQVMCKRQSRSVQLCKSIADIMLLYEPCFMFLDVAIKLEMFCYYINIVLACLIFCFL